MKKYSKYAIGLVGLCGLTTAFADITLRADAPTVAKYDVSFAAVNVPAPGPDDRSIVSLGTLNNETGSSHTFSSPPKSVLPNGSYRIQVTLTQRNTLMAETFCSNSGQSYAFTQRSLTEISFDPDSTFSRGGCGNIGGSKH